MRIRMCLQIPTIFQNYERNVFSVIGAIQLQKVGREANNEALNI
jgi:hypothetical protein